MRVGVPSEIKVHEYRVGLTPGAVREYVAHGHQVVVQSGAGAGIMASDDAYRAAGAEIAATAAEIFAGCDMIVKVKEPQPSEWVLLRPGQFKFIPFAPIEPETRFVAVIGDYRNQENATWQQVLRIPPRGRQIILSVLVNDTHIVLKEED